MTKDEGKGRKRHNRVAALVALAFAGLSLGDLEPLLEEGDFRESALERCPDETVLRFFARYGLLSDERRRTWSLPVLNKVTPLLGAPQIRKMLPARSGGIAIGERCSVVRVP
jgi:hypothetical protein